MFSPFDMESLIMAHGFFGKIYDIRKAQYGATQDTQVQEMTHTFNVSLRL